MLSFPLSHLLLLRLILLSSSFLLQASPLTFFIYQSSCFIFLSSLFFSSRFCLIFAFILLLLDPRFLVAPYTCLFLISPLSYLSPCTSWLLFLPSSLMFSASFLSYTPSPLHVFWPLTTSSFTSFQALQLFSLPFTLSSVPSSSARSHSLGAGFVTRSRRYVFLVGGVFLSILSAVALLSHIFTFFFACVYVLLLQCWELGLHNALK